MSAEQAQAGSRKVTARLFIAGQAPNSRAALENLRRLREELPGNRFEVEIIDVLETPQVAMEQGIYVTPALQVTEPAPGVLIFGNLSDAERLREIFV